MTSLRIANSFAGLALGATIGGVLAWVLNWATMTSDELVPFVKNMMLGVGLAGDVAGWVGKRQLKVGAAFGFFLLGVALPLVDFFGFYPREGWIVMYMGVAGFSGAMGGALTGGVLWAAARLLGALSRRRAEG